MRAATPDLHGGEASERGDGEGGADADLEAGQDAEGEDLGDRLHDAAAGGSVESALHVVAPAPITSGVERLTCPDFFTPRATAFSKFSGAATGGHSARTCHSEPAGR